MNKKQVKRWAGVLMPVASLPSREGCGCFGSDAYRFVDLLCDLGVGIWQLLPLNPLGYGNSPYQPFYSMAGEELYISLEMLEREGLLPAGWEPFEAKEADRIDYEAVKAYKEKYLQSAAQVFCRSAAENREYQAFCALPWVKPYAVFKALKKQNGLRPWNEWPKEQQDWILDGRYDISHLKPEIDYTLFTQFIFRKQWQSLKAYMNGKGLLVMGDIPFYVGIDSLDVWSAREDFLLDTDGRPSFIAGVPPDYFNAEGQRWGNPIYDWERMEKTGFTFWVNRLQYNAEMFDILRIDHFRAFDTYWKIPASCPTAMDGDWIEAPGYALFDQVFNKIPNLRLIAEDLGGDLRPALKVLMDHYRIPGMNVAQFTVLSDEALRRNQLIYTGTHDNQTTRGYYRDLPEGERKRYRKKLSPYGEAREAISRHLRHSPL